MKKLLLFILVAFGFFTQYSFAQTVAELQKNAQAFMRQGDYTNAVLILNRCIEKEPTNTSVGKDLALSYFYTQNNSKALEVIKPVLESNDADDQCFLIAGNIYKQLELPKESEKVYKKGIVKFPESGPIYNELGQIQIAAGSRDAIKTWEKGIKADPSYSKNYYNAARFYFFEKDYVWSILYCEIFANMEPNNNLVSEIKKMLLESYKQMFLDTDLDKNNKSKNAFVASYLGEIKKQTGVLSNGINAETLFMIRSRFIIDWFATNNKPAFRLFDYQQQLLRAGMFEAYNQWLFGITENLGAYQVWVKTNAEENNAFLSFQKSRIFKIPVGQYYH
jgi:tetratricopeptide (TPR) repeat protein